MREIRSSSNPTIKLYRHALKEGRTREGWLAVEGPLLLEEALNAASSAPAAPERQRGEPALGKLLCKSTVRSVVVTPEAAEKFALLLERLPRDAERIEVRGGSFSTLSQTVNPQGIAALVEVQPPQAEAVLGQPGAVLIVACGLQDPGNLGTILRAAEALGAVGVICLKATVSPANPKVLRACGGAVFRLPVFAGIEPDPLFDQMRSKGVRIIAADRESPLRIHEADLSGALAFLIGNEAGGLDDELWRRADMRLSIPMLAKIDSINAAMAATICLYEVARQHGFH